VDTRAISFREGKAPDLRAAYELGELSSRDGESEHGIGAAAPRVGDPDLSAGWARERSLLEFMAAQPDGCFWVGENADGLVAYARTVRFGGMEELTELAVAPDHAGLGLGRELLARCWPNDPSPQLGRALVASAAPRELTLYTDFGVMPAGGHWDLRQETAAYLKQRSLETDAPDPSVHVLKPELAVAEWQRLEPGALGHERPLLHEFFGRDRTCLARFHTEGHVLALCWVSSEGEIGPAVASEPEHLVPVVLAALDRIARTQAPSELGLACTTTSWWLLRRLRGLGFRVRLPSWIMSSVPLPGLDRYVPTSPARLL